MCIRRKNTVFFSRSAISTGPGGLIRAYRAIPMFAEIAEAIKSYAPDAWVINYTNR